MLLHEGMEGGDYCVGVSQGVLWRKSYGWVFLFCCGCAAPLLKMWNFMSVLWSRIVLSPFCRAAMEYETHTYHGFLILLQIPPKMDAFTVWSCLNFPKVSMLQSKLQPSVLMWILCRAKTWFGDFFSKWTGFCYQHTRHCFPRMTVSTIQSVKREVLALL